MKLLRLQKRIRLVYLIIALVFMSTVGTSLIQTYIGYRSEIRSLSKQTLNLNYENSNNMSRTMTAIFSSMENGLKATADYFANGELLDSERQQALDLFIHNGGYFNSVIYVDEQEVIRTRSPQLSGSGLTKITSPQAKEAFRSQKPSLSDPYISPTNKLLVLVTYPIWDEAGLFRGYIGGTIYLHELNVLSKIFGGQVAGETGSYAYVLDRHGNILFHPDSSRLGSNDGQNKIVKQVILGKQGSDIVTSSDGKIFLAGYTQVIQNGWGIIVQTPQTEIITSAYTLVKSQMFSSLPLILVFLLVTMWVARKLTSPFVVLAETARQISAGQSIHVPYASHWNHEAHLLTQSMRMAVEGLQQKAEQYSLQANTDALTGLLNRRTMNQYTESWKTSGTPFSLLTLDIDHFKAVNDTFGHQSGDEVLQYLASTILAEAGRSDICCRFGGEEFVVLTLAGPHEAFALAERMRRKIESSPSPIGPSITVSIGVASFPSDTADLKELFSYADQALYQAKNGGRNRTIRYLP
ncbi:diguanylate cyclase [Paenibacillus sp. GCM10023252]|uniref:sensor domain-containing diguanylate cyclase n=1 Tax=Paenibacillus sp. GCM10023252 TaxID=3252649 RepID=UPI0036112A94